MENLIKDKYDLKNEDIVTLRNGDRLILIDDEFLDISGEKANNLSQLSNLNDDLTSNYGWGDDIVKVSRPVAYTTVYERKTTTKKKMTVSEICKALGYDVEIIKEEK